MTVNMKLSMYDDVIQSIDDYSGKIVLSLSRFENEDEWFNEIMHVIKALIYNDEVLVVRLEEKGIVIIEHEHDEDCGDHWGCSTPRWLTPDEVDTLEFNRENIMREQLHKVVETFKKEEEYDCD